MKSITNCTTCSLFLLFCCLFSMRSLHAQAQLESKDCNTLKAFYISPNSAPTTATGIYSFVLEKEIIPGIWKKIQMIETQKQETLFTAIAKTTYRVTIITPTYRKDQKTKIYHHLKEHTNTANTFLSNAVILGTNCDSSVPGIASQDVQKNHNPITLYPNPSQDRLWVAWKSTIQITDLSLYTITGILLQQTTPNGNKTEIDVSSFKPGIYLLKASNRENIIAIERLSIVR